MIKEFLSQKQKDLYKKSLSDEQKMDLLNEIIHASSGIVFLGGAGISECGPVIAECRLPDNWRDIPGSGICSVTGTQLSWKVSDHEDRK